MKTLIEVEIFHPDFTDSQKIELDWKLVLEPTNSDYRLRLEVKNDGIDYVESKQIKEDHYDEINHLLPFDIVHFELCDLFSLHREIDLQPKKATWENGTLEVVF